GAELSTLTSLAIAPYDLESFEARRIIADLQLSPRERKARTVIARLGIGQVDIVIFGIVRREEDAQHSTLTLPENGWNVRNGRLCSLLGDQPQSADLLRDEHPTVGQESNLPGQIQRRDLGHGKGQVRVRFLLACVNLRR